MTTRSSRRTAATSATSSATSDDDARVSRAMEFAVEMRCGKCVETIERALRAIPGTTSARATLSASTVVAETSANSHEVMDVIRNCGYKVRLIGQGSTLPFGDALARELGTDARTLRQSLACVGEFKGEKYAHGDARGVVRFVQVSEDVLVVEGAFDGLTTGAHAICVHEYGDVTAGAASAGEVYARDDDERLKRANERSGFIGVVVADASGAASMPSTVLTSALKAWDVIGRAVVVHASERVETEGAIAAVLARSAGVGENHKKLCQCDGTVIWEAGEDFLPVKVDAKDANGGLLVKGTTTARRG